MEIRISGLTDESIVDGKGFRYVVFTQGCPHHCKGCHNPDTWDENAGKFIDTDKIYDEFCENPLLKGITFSGGEPFMQPEPLYYLAKKVHELKKDVTVYTGYTYEQLLESENLFTEKLLSQTDILIDGKFELELKNLELKFRGSENQRVIDMNKTREEGHIVLDED